MTREKLAPTEQFLLKRMQEAAKQEDYMACYHYSVALSDLQKFKRLSVHAEGFAKILSEIRS